MQLKAIINVRVSGNHDELGNGYEIRIYDTSGEKPVFIRACSLSETPVKEIKAYTLNLPFELLNFRVINLPNLAHKKLRDLVPYEIEGSILTKREDLVFDFLTEANDDGTLKTLVIYIDRQVLQKIIAPLKESGINPAVITCSGLRGALSGGIEGLAERMLRPESQSLKEAPEEGPEIEGQELVRPVIRLSDREITVADLKEGLIKPIFRTSTLLVVLFAILAVWLIFDLTTGARELGSLKKELRSRYTTLFPEDRKVSDENYQLQSRIRALKDKGESLIGISAIEMLMRLSSSKVEGVIISELSVDKDTIKLKGESPSIEAIEAYKKGLVWVNNLVVSDVTQAEKGLYSFRLSGRLKRDK